MSGNHSQVTNAESSSLNARIIDQSNPEFQTEALERAEAVMSRMRAEIPTMDGNSSYTYEYSNNSRGASPGVSTSEHSVRRVTSSKTTTSSAVKPPSAADIAMSTLERDFNRIGRLPDDYTDDFDKLRQQILSGDAYKQDSSDQLDGFSETSRTSQKSSTQYSTPAAPVYYSQPPAQNTIPSEVQTSAQNPVKSHEADRDTASPSPGKMYRSEVFIPVRRHHAPFSDYYKNRWLEHNTSQMDAEFDTRRRDWESQLDRIRNDFFQFSPFHDSHPTIESSKTVSTSPAGKPEFSVQFEVKDFKPEEINVSTKDGKLIIAAIHEEKSGNNVSRREYKRTVVLPQDVQVTLMRSVLAKDGVLSVTAPIKAPTYGDLPGSGHVTQQHAKALQTTSSASTVSKTQQRSPLNYTMSVAGYNPEEVSVTVEGRKVKVHAKHDEASSGRKLHNEMTKTFDLPQGVDAHHVRCFIKDGSTLCIESHFPTDILGKIHIVPINHK